MKGLTLVPDPAVLSADEIVGSLECDIQEVNLNGAVVTVTIFVDTTSRGVAKEQLYSTASRILAFVS